MTKAIMILAVAVSGYWTDGPRKRSHWQARAYPSLQACEADRQRVVEALSVEYGNGGVHAVCFQAVG